MVDERTGSPRDQPAVPWRLSRLALAVAVAWLGALLVVKLWRAGCEASLWMDEIYTLELVRHPWLRLLDLARGDFSPPLYYLSLKAWLDGAAWLGMPRSLLLARALNVAAWVVLLLALERTWRRFRSPAVTAAVVVAVAGSAHAVQFTHDLRSYGFAFVGLTIALSVLTLDLCTGQRTARHAGWFAYVPAALVALWSHLLAWPILALAGLGWLALRVRSRGREGPGGRLAPGLLAHGVALAGAAPGLFRAVGQLRTLRAADPGWMTPPTLANLLRVFVEWLPFGRNGVGSGAGGGLALALGVATLLPAAVALLERWRTRGARSRPRSPLVGVGALCLTIAFVFVVGLWAAQRAGWFHAFHGPRYPGLVSGLWAIGLVLLAWGAGQEAGRPDRAWIWLAPWLLVSAYANLHALTADRQGALAMARAELDARFPPAARRLFFEPASLQPFLRETLDEIGARPIDDFFCAPEGDQAAVVLHLNRWPELDTPEERLVRYAFARGRLGASDRVEIPRATRDFAVQSLGLDARGAALVASWCRAGVRIPDPFPGRTGPKARVEDQLGADGWSYLEFDAALLPYRWSAADEVTVRFDAPFIAGSVELEIVGYREPRPAAVERLTIVVPCAGSQLDLDLGPGAFDRNLPLELPGACRGAREIRLRHPLWELERANVAGGVRRLGLQFRGAALSPPRR